MKNLILLLTVLTFLFSCKSNPKEEYDICIYGGTSAGVIACWIRRCCLSNRKAASAD